MPGSQTQFSFPVNESLPFGRLQRRQGMALSHIGPESVNYILGGPHAHRIRKPDGWPLRKIGAEHMSLTVTQGCSSASG